MGNRGPLPLPNEILRARGSRLANRNQDGPVVPVAKPDAPEWLKGEALAEWRRLVGLLFQSRMVAKLDGNLLARYCELYTQWLRERDLLEKFGYKTATLQRDADGNVVGVKKLKTFDVFMDLHRDLVQLENLLGLNISARARLRAEAVDADAATKSQEQPQEPEKEVARVKDKSRFFAS